MPISARKRCRLSVSVSVSLSLALTSEMSLSASSFVELVERVPERSQVLGAPKKRIKDGEKVRGLELMIVGLPGSEIQ